MQFGVRGTEKPGLVVGSEPFGLPSRLSGDQSVTTGGRGGEVENLFLLDCNWEGGSLQLEGRTEVLDLVLGVVRQPALGGSVNNERAMPNLKKLGIGHTSVRAAAKPGKRFESRVGW